MNNFSENNSFEMVLKLQQNTQEDRIINAIASTASPDHAGDTLNMQNWNFTRFMKNPVFLYAHNLEEMRVPVGIIKAIRVVNNQLWISIYFPKIEELTSYFGIPELIHEHAKFIDLLYNAYKCGLIKGISVGFDGEWTPRVEKDVMIGRAFSMQVLIEISSVPIPCNEDALSKIGTIPETIKQFIGGKHMEIKTGARLSRESKETLQGIYREMADIHKQYMDGMKGCHERLAKFIEPPCADERNDEGHEETKSFENLLDCTIKIIKE